jgi:capsular polysaccharide biosynthesis protein
MENVVLEDGSFYCKGWRSRVSERPTSWSGGAPAEMDRAALSTSWSASIYFSHWLSDDLTMFLAAERLSTPITVARPLYSDEPYYAQAFDIHVKPLTRARFNRFVYLQDVAQNSFKRRRYEELRSRLRMKHPEKGAERVFLCRGKNGAERGLVNENALEQILAREGFTILDPERLSTKEIAQACAGAKIALGVEGSQLIHGFMGTRPDGAIIAMVPPARFMTHFKDLSDCIGLRYGMIVGTPTGAGFRIDAGELLHLLDRVEQQLA